MQACPGAGKTETILGRVGSLLTGLPPRRGVAVLSFTNAALEEFTRRCREASLERVLTHPHYVGTFDSFIRRFLVLPGGVDGCNDRPNIVDSWRTLGVDLLGGIHRMEAFQESPLWPALSRHFIPKREVFARERALCERWKNCCWTLWGIAASMKRWRRRLLGTT